MNASPAAVLSLADLEAHDPGAKAGGTERRFLCPLPACADHQRPSLHRNLTVNTTTGAWNCKRCHATGKLREWWEEKPAFTPSSHRERTRRRFRQSMELPPEKVATPADDGPQEWRQKLVRLQPLAGTPGAAYLAARGIPEDLAHAAGVRFSPSWYGRPAVVFPLRDGSGTLRAAQGRLITDSPNGPSKLSAGPITRGVFVTSNASEALRRGEPVAIVEAPIDALSLAAAGLPAFALCGTEIGEARRDWFLPLLAWHPILLGFDADDPGDGAADRWEHLLRSCGAQPRRLRPEGAKDWNALLLQHGADSLRTTLALILPSGSDTDTIPHLEPAKPQDGAPDRAGGVSEEALAPAISSEPDPATAEDLLSPFADVIFAAVDGELPESSVSLAPGHTAIDPARVTLQTARDVVRLAATGQAKSSAMASALQTLSALSDWWDAFIPDDSAE